MKILHLMAIPIMFALSSCGGKIERHYRIDVAIDTPQGVRTGHGVIRFRTSPTLDRHTGNRSPEVKGEAVPVEVSRGRYVFMLVDALGMGWEVYGPWVPDDRMADLERGVTVPMDPKNIPGFATFSDIRNPHSVKPVFLSGVKQNGPYKLKYVTITRSDGPITSGSSDVLSWLNEDNSKESAINSTPADDIVSKTSYQSFIDMVRYDSFKRNI